MQRLNLCPLLLVPCGRRLKRAAHPVQRATAARTFGWLWPTHNLEALATLKAGMSDQVAAAARGWLVRRRTAIVRISPKCHAPKFLVRLHAGPNA
jgi:hypothetical protein